MCIRNYLYDRGYPKEMCSMDQLRKVFSGRERTGCAILESFAIFYCLIGLC